MKNEQIYSESTRRETVANILKNQNVNLPCCEPRYCDIIISQVTGSKLSPCHTVALIFTGSCFFYIPVIFQLAYDKFWLWKNWPNIYIKDQLNILTEPGLRLDQNQFRCILPLQYSVITYVMLTGRHVCIKRSQSCREEKWIALI